MCVSSSGCQDDVIATPRVKSRGPPRSGARRAIAPTSASELVRVSSPSFREMRGSTPVSRRRCSSVCVPQVPAANTTCSAR